MVLDDQRHSAVSFMCYSSFCIKFRLRIKKDRSVSIGKFLRNTSNKDAIGVGVAQVRLRLAPGIINRSMCIVMYMLRANLVVPTNETVVIPKDLCKDLSRFWAGGLKV